MNTRALSLALIISFVAMMMVYLYIEDQKAIINKNYGSMVQVIVAKQDIKELDLLDDRKVKSALVPRNFAHESSFRSIKDIENTIATVPILKGEQITRPRVTYPGAKTGLSRQVSVGKRGMAIAISDERGVSRLIKPGDRVDVIFPVQFADRLDFHKVQTILQDVLILSVGMNMTNAIPIYGIKSNNPGVNVIKKMNANVYTKYNTVTLELDPYQVQKYIFIKTYGGGAPFLSLRNNNDKKKEKIGTTDLYDILSEEDSIKAKKYFLEKYKNRK